MRTLVYKFALRPPDVNAPLVEAQLRLGHDYRNDLVAIERGRRRALRELLEASPDVTEATRIAKAATRSTRKEAVANLRAARRTLLSERRCEGGQWPVSVEDAEVYPFSALYETERIELLTRRLRKDAYNYYGDRGLAWGTRLHESAAADQARKAALYGDDELTPSEPKFARWGRADGGPGDGTLAVQLQGGLRTADAGKDTRVQYCARRIDRVRPDGAHQRPHFRDERLRLRVGSDGRAPVWAEWPLVQSGHRAIPDEGRWKWVRVHRRGGEWSVDFTIELLSPRPRELVSLSGVIAVEVVWDQPGDRIVVARWRDDAGQLGIIKMSERDEKGIRKPNSIRSIRDRILFGDKESHLPGLADQLVPLLRAEHLPGFLTEARETMHLWRSPGRFLRLWRRWLDSRWESMTSGRAWDLLDEWKLREDHLAEYERNMRATALRRRDQWYQRIAADWSRQYRSLITDDRVLSREARFGDASDMRFVVAPSELRDALRYAFGSDANEHPYRRESEEDERDWCERAVDAYLAGGARKTHKRSKSHEKQGGAWAARKEQKQTRHAVSADRSQTDSQIVKNTG